MCTHLSFLLPHLSLKSLSGPLLCRKLCVLTFKLGNWVRLLYDNVFFFLSLTNSNILCTFTSAQVSDIQAEWSLHPLKSMTRGMRIMVTLLSSLFVFVTVHKTFQHHQATGHRHQVTCVLILVVSKCSHTLAFHFTSFVYCGQPAGLNNIEQKGISSSLRLIQPLLKK